MSVHTSAPKRVETVSAFLAEIEALQTGPFPPELWFRGHGDKTWELKPTILRKWFIDRVEKLNLLPEHYPDRTNEALECFEVIINARFRRQGGWLMQTADVVDVYFLARHHDFPTRLLDWTTNALAALFFAVSEKPQTDGEVIVITPHDARLFTNDLTQQRAGRPTDVRDRRIRAEIDALFVGLELAMLPEGELPPVVLPIRPDVRAGRMFQQGACFTLHLRRAAPLNETHVVRLQIQAACKPRIQNDLRTLGVSWATLFPDLDYLCREIRTEWALYPPEC